MDRRHPRLRPTARPRRERVRLGAPYRPSDGRTGTVIQIWVRDDDGCLLQVEAAYPVEVHAMLVLYDRGGSELLGCSDGLTR